MIGEIDSNIRFHTLTRDAFVEMNRRALAAMCLYHPERAPRDLLQKVKAALARREAEIERIEQNRQEKLQKYRPRRGTPIPAYMADIIADVGERHDVTAAAILGSGRTDREAIARQEVFYRIWMAHPTGNPSASGLGRWFNKDHTTILYGIHKHCARTGDPTPPGMKADGFARKVGQRQGGGA